MKTNTLTIEQLAFLKKYDVDLKFVFNAQGLSKKEYRPIMKELNKLVAFGVTPCKKSGHTLRTRSGHCCQCQTKHLAFQKRHDSGGVLYIAKSSNGNLIKVGFTHALSVRDESLNRTGYAGFRDWRILYAISSPAAGKIETMTKCSIREHALSQDYFHDGQWRGSSETYKYDSFKTKLVVLKVINENNYVYETIRNVLA